MSTPFDNDNYSDADDLVFNDGKIVVGEGTDTRGILGGVAGAFSSTPPGTAGKSVGQPPRSITPLSGTQLSTNAPISGNMVTSGGSSPSSGTLQDDGSTERNNIITARGTSEGLVLRIDGRVQPSDLLPAVKDFLNGRRSFLSGHDVAFEWIGKKADETLISELTLILANEFAITVRSSRLKATSKAADTNQGALATTTTPLTPLNLADSIGAATVTQPGLSVVGGKDRSAPSISSSVEKTISLFDGMEGFDAKMGGSGNAMLWDEPDARLVYGTLRSGQKIETEHSVVVFGDVNSGAEVIAGGDIIILGTLRGIAHAGAYDESGGGRVIFALNLQPTQLRIGLVISRGASGDMRQISSERGEKGANTAPEIARVDNNMIVVELYQSRTVWVRRRE